MAITGELEWKEGPLAVANGKSTTEERYLVYGDDPNDDRDNALDWLLSNASTSLYGLRRDKVDVGEVIKTADGNGQPLKIWPGVVKYVNPERRKPKPLPVDDQAPSTAPQATRLSIRSGSGGSRRLTYSQGAAQTIYSGAAYNWGDGSTQAIGKMLNLKADDNEDTGAMFIAQGIDVPAGTVEIVVETVRLNESITTDGYLVEVSEYAAKNVINSKVYKGFPIGSLKLINFSADQRGGDEGDTANNVEPWDVVYTFQYQAGAEAADLNNKLPPGLEGQTWGADSEGWQYLDVLYINTEVPEANTGAKFVMPQAERAAFHNIYDKIDFADKLKI